MEISEEKIRKYKRSMKNIGGGLKGSAMTFIGAGTLAIAPISAPVSIPMLVKGAFTVQDALANNYSTNSVMKVTNNNVLKSVHKYDNYIYQSPSLKSFGEGLSLENDMEGLNFF